MADTIFSKILSGEIPSHKIYEDELVYAFLDVGPLSEGHTLLIPKEPAVTMDQLSERSAEALGRVMPRLCRAVKKATGCDQYNLLQNNGALAHQAVMHLHFHIIPKPNEREGLGVGWPGKSIDHEAGAALAQKIAAALDG
jgi:histidine triad (HIT) family protein